MELELLGLVVSLLSPGTLRRARLIAPPGPGGQGDLNPRAVTAFPVGVVWGSLGEGCGTEPPRRSEVAYEGQSVFSQHQGPVPGTPAG